MDMFLKMTVTHGSNSETVTVPAVLDEKYETVITNGHDQSTKPEPLSTEEANTTNSHPTAEKAVNGATVNGESTLPAIPTVDHKTEAAIPPPVSLNPEPKLSAPAVNGDAHKDVVDSFAVPANDSTDQAILPAATRLKRFLTDTDDILVCPGVYDGFSARIALSVGFQAMYMVSWSSFMSSSSRLVEAY